MTTLTIKLPDKLDRELSQAAERSRTSKAALATKALQEYLSRQPNEQAADRTVADLAGHLFGSIDADAPTDLSTNKAHLEGFGK